MKLAVVIHEAEEGDIVTGRKFRPFPDAGTKVNPLKNCLTIHTKRFKAVYL